MSKRINYEDFLQVPETPKYQIPYSKEISLHENAKRIADFTNDNKFKSGYIEHSFGYGKTETIKYLMAYNKKLNLSELQITYIDATILDIYSDSKVVVFSKVISYILETQSREGQMDKNLILQLCKLNNAIKRGNEHLINFLTELQILKRTLSKTKNLIVFDELDRVDASFAKFLMISIGNNISSNGNILLWIISNRERIFGEKMNKDIEKYAEHKIELTKVDSMDIFLENIGSNFDFEKILIVKHLIGPLLPRHILNIIQHFNMCSKNKKVLSWFNENVRRTVFGYKNEMYFNFICLFISILYFYKTELKKGEIFEMLRGKYSLSDQDILKKLNNWKIHSSGEDFLQENNTKIILLHWEKGSKILTFHISMNSIFKFMKIMGWHV